MKTSSRRSWQRNPLYEQVLSHRNMAAQKIFSCSPLNFISMQIRGWIKQRFSQRSYFFSRNAMKNSPSSSLISSVNYPSLYPIVPYEHGWNVLESGQCGITKIRNDANDCDFRHAKTSHSPHQIKSKSLKTEELGFDNSFTGEWLHLENGTKVSERTLRIDKFAENATCCCTKPKGTFSLDADDFNRVKPQRILNIYTDASGRYGLGCVWEKKWIVSQWEDEWLALNFRCMELLEMKAILVSILTWGPDWTGSIVRIHCDNKIVVDYFNHRMRLNRKVFSVYRSIRQAVSEFGFKLVMEQANKSHIKFQGSDSLSRLDFRRFHNLLPYMNHMPDLPPENLEFLPPNIWENICVAVKLRSHSYDSGHR